MGKCSLEELPRQGYYILLFELLGEISVSYAGRNVVLEPGVYAYIGSALRSLRNRVGRHVHSGAARIHWHIDRVTTAKAFKPLAVAACDSTMRGLEECIAGHLWTLGLRGPRGFGSSDTKSPTHLYRLPDDLADSLGYVTGALASCCRVEPVVVYC